MVGMRPLTGVRRVAMPPWMTFGGVLGHLAGERAGPTGHSDVAVLSATRPLLISRAETLFTPHYHEFTRVLRF